MINNQKPFFSIVIPTLNEEKYLPLLLEDLASQTNNSFEVIHIDGSSEDKTVAIATEFQTKLDIKTEIVEIQNVSYQRNKGTKLAKGEWIIFMDADNRIEPSFLDGIKYRIAQDETIDLFTTWVSIEEGRTINKQMERTINFILELSTKIGKEWSFGALIGVKKEITKKFKFDQDQKIAEDGLFITKIINSGYNFKIFRDPRYKYSLRRLETEGALNYTRSIAKIAINYLQGKDFKNEDFGYSMNGGTYYDNKNYFNFTKLPFYIKSLPKKQIEQVKKLFKNLTETGL